jgi:hypothetical protein
LQLPYDPLRWKKELEEDYIEERIGEQDTKKKKKGPITEAQKQFIQSRRIKYTLKKNDNKSLLIVPHEEQKPVDPKDPHCTTIINISKTNS